MSAIGTKRTSPFQSGMSAFDPFRTWTIKFYATQSARKHLLIGRFRLVGRPLAHPRADDRSPMLEHLWLRAVVGYPTEGAPDARGGPVPKICNRVPNDGPTGLTNGRQTSLESLS